MPRRCIASARANHAQPPRWSAGSVKGAACRGAYQRPVRRGARKTPELSRVRLLACRRRPEAAGLSATTSGTPRFDKDRSATSCSRPLRLRSLVISVQLGIKPRPNYKAPAGFFGRERWSRRRATRVIGISRVRYTKRASVIDIAYMTKITNKLKGSDRG